MRKTMKVIVGAIIGIGAGVAIHYLLGPSEPSGDGVSPENDVPYKSRLDAAIEAGRQAAAAREAELTANFEEAKRIKGG